MVFEQNYYYDVVISYAGEDREYANALADALRLRGIIVFYDRYEKATLWGKNLYDHLYDVYQNKALYCVIFFSKYYISKVWTKHELQAAQARALSEKDKEYLLPVRLDESEIPSVLSTTAYLNWYDETAEIIADMILEKLSAVARAYTSPISALRRTPPLISQESKSNRVTEEPLIQRKAIGDQIKDNQKHNRFENNSDEIIRSLYTVLDIGTAYAKAMIIEVQDDIGVVLGMGRYQQSYSHMSDGIITDLAGVITNCNEALIKAEQSAGGIIAPSAVIGITGELIKGSSITISMQRQQPTKHISPEELESMISSAQQKLLKIAKERIAAEIGYPSIDVRLTNAKVISVRIDGQIVYNPIGLCGHFVDLTLFSVFAPLTLLSTVETVAKGLDLTLVMIGAGVCALAGLLSVGASEDSGAIFIDIGACTTDIALVRQGEIEEIRIFALGGRTFTRRLAASKGISVKEAEKLKLSYSNGGTKGNERDEIQTIFASEAQTWMDIVEVLIEEMAKGELLPPAIYLVGGGSILPDLRQRLEHFPWTKRLPFSRQPIIETIQPTMVTNIVDPNYLLRNAQDITPMALAYQAVKLQNEDNVLERALYRVIRQMHI